MLTALFAAVALQPAASTIVLFRGAELPGQTTRYWAVQDTTLDGTKPSQNFGGLPFLGAGPNRTVLLRFGDLNRALGSGRVASAKLTLRVSGGQTPGLERASRLKQPWREGGEGPVRPWAPRPAAGAEAAPGNPTWSHRVQGLARWSQSGARALEDGDPVSGVRIETGEDATLVLTGLESIVQGWLQSPESNFGLALNFTGPTEFLSSESPEGAPRLEVTLEPGVAPAGPDLSLAWVTRDEPTPRPRITEWETFRQDGREVRLPKSLSPDSEWPQTGTSLRYLASIRNLGTSRSEGGVLSVIGADGVPRRVDFPAVGPGESINVEVFIPFAGLTPGYKLRPIRFQILPTGPAQPTENDALSFDEAALSLEIRVPTALAERIGPRLADRVQAHLRAMNEWVLPHSRFSFAPNGALERLHIQRILVTDEPATEATDVDGIAVLPQDAQLQGLDRGVLAAFLRSVGLVSTTSERAVPIRPLPPLPPDPFPGLLGYGDTRNETNLPSVIPLPSAPVGDVLLESAGIQSTDLLAATDVGALNARLGRRLPPLGDHLFLASGVIFIRARNLQGRALPETLLEFFVPGTDQPVMTATTSKDGLVTLPRRPVPGGSFRSATGAILVPGPFGTIDPRGGNDILWVRASNAGVSEWTAFKAWQLVDSKLRTPGISATAELFFNLGTGPVEPDSNLARGRQVRDSGRRLPAQLIGLVDDQPGVTALPDGPGAWVEIDLGRDRVVGEIVLQAPRGAMWSAFDIVGYSTGQTVSEALPWTLERSFRWAESARGEAVPAAEQIRVGYRAFAQRVRVIRIINRGNSAGSLGKVIVRQLAQPE